MHNFIRITTLAVMITGAAASAGAATPNEFYTSLLRRGIASHDAGRFPEASRQLRIAAFGLVEAVDQYEIAQVYLALTYDKLQEHDRAREAARRVAAAEKVERKYSALSIPSGVRSSFDTIANRLLAPGDLGILRGTAPVPPPPAATPATTIPSRTTTTAQTTTPPRRTTPTTPQQTTAPQTTQPQSTTPARTQTQPAQQPASTPVQQTTAPQPKPATQPATTPAKPPATATTPAVKPPQTSTAKPPQTAATKPATQPPPASTPATTKPAPAPAPTATAAKPLTASEINARVTAAERALNAANLNEARRLYRELLANTTLEHDTLIRIAEGLYRSRDFANALTAFSRVGTLRRGEEPYRYYIAVALYETGDYARAKKELAAALPYIEVTPDVERYRTKIEGAM